MGFEDLCGLYTTHLYDLLVLEIMVQSPIIIPLHRAQWICFRIFLLLIIAKRKMGLRDELSNASANDIAQSAIDELALTESKIQPSSGDPSKVSKAASQPLQEIFSRCRSKSDGSMTVLPKKGSLKKNTDAAIVNLRRRVSFADTNGFALEQVRTFVVQPSFDFDDEEDFLPRKFEVTRPSVGFDDDKDEFLLKTAKSRFMSERRFVPYFTLPWSAGKKGLVFAALVDRNVCLESFLINSPWKISGTILVKNLSYHKRVFIRQTLDKWQTYTDVEATFLNNANENVDRFGFELQFAFKLPPGTRLELAFGYEVPDGRGQYWDNNCKNNYAFWYNDKA